MSVKTKEHITPPAGPAWAGSLMGTSIAATESHIFGLPVLACFLLLVATAICVVIAAGWCKHRTPPFSPVTMAPWGMLAMGILALGSAWTKVTGQLAFQEISWLIGTPLSFVVLARQLQKFPEGSPNFQWGLALVAPMVAATSSGQLAHEYPLLKAVGIVCFGAAWLAALPVFFRCYLDVLGRRMVIPPALGGTAWIPLGLVGQSTAAAHLLFPTNVARIYGFTILSVGVLLAAYACLRFGHTVLTWAGYSPGWWGSTFPVGTCCLGAYYLDAVGGVHWMGMVAHVLLFWLLIHWVLCVARWATWLLAPRSVS
ncbi:hypothetical protein QVA66_10730 [Staphylococcus chromogenes]|nr:hypothetical protein [Staphylococcus chromogenes]